MPALTPEEDARDSLESYNDAMRAIGERVKAGAQVPAFLKGCSGLPAIPPESVKAEQAKADAIIAYAAKMQDWPLLEQAIDLKIEQQREFAGWWIEGVQRKGRPTGNGKK